MPIGDELFQLAHTRIGTLQIRELTFRQTLAAALLGETMLENLATIVDGHMQPLKPPKTEPVLGNDGNIYPGWSPVSETPVATYLHAAMTHDGAKLRPVRTWLDYVALWGYGAVSLRLMAAGQLRQVPFMIKPGVYHEPTNPKYDIAGVRIAHTLSTSQWQQTPRSDVVLAALLSASGLLDHVLVYPERAGECRERLFRLISELPPAFATLLKEAQAALDGKVLAAR